nr:Alpha-ketoglutarate permease [Klebsiella pneumoniae]
MRPIGGWLFGRIADRRGRKTSMLISVCMMCFGSLVIACLPGYAVIGTGPRRFCCWRVCSRAVCWRRIRHQCDLYE